MQIARRDSIVKVSLVLPCIIYFLMAATSTEADTFINNCTSQVLMTISGETYKLSNDIFAGDITCLEIRQGSDITLDCQGYTIDGNGTGIVGIIIADGYGFTGGNIIKNCVLTDWPNGIVYYLHSTGGFPPINYPSTWGNYTLDNVDVTCGAFPNSGILIQGLGGGTGSGVTVHDVTTTGCSVGFQVLPSVTDYFIMKMNENDFNGNSFCDVSVGSCAQSADFDNATCDNSYATACSCGDIPSPCVPVPTTTTTLGCGGSPIPLSYSGSLGSEVTGSVVEATCGIKAFLFEFAPAYWLILIVAFFAIFIVSVFALAKKR